MDRPKLFNLKGIDMPARCCKETFQRFERQNPEYALNVYTLPITSKNRDDLQPVYVSPTRDLKLITLLVLFDPNPDQGSNATKEHYTTVTSFGALMRCGTNEEAICRRCLHEYVGPGAAQRLERHAPECRGIMNGDVQRITMPREGVDDKLMFTASERTLRAPFAIYLDFESSIVPVEASEHIP